MHIHPSSPNSDISLQSEESAAIKIQAGFRGYRVRRQLNSRQQSRSFFRAHQVHNFIFWRQHRHQQQGMAQTPGFSDMSATSAQTQLISDGSGGSSMEDRCATKIQAGVRGFLVRKKQKVATAAATKIQAGYRGFKARKEAQKLKEQ